MTQKEIDEKKTELRKKLEEASTTEELQELRGQIEEINKEVPVEEEKKDGDITPEEERSLIADTQELEKRSVDATDLTKMGGKEEMEERKKQMFNDAMYNKEVKIKHFLKLEKYFFEND